MEHVKRGQWKIERWEDGSIDRRQKNKLDNDSADGQRNQGTTPRKSVAEGSILIKKIDPHSLQNRPKMAPRKGQMDPPGPKWAPWSDVKTLIGALRETPGAKKCSKRRHGVSHTIYSSKLNFLI